MTSKTDCKVTTNKSNIQIFDEKNLLCSHKYIFSGKKVVFARSCERNFGGIAVGKAASEGTTKIAHMQVFEHFFYE